MTVDINKRVAQYVSLRDKIKVIKEKHSEELAPYSEMLEQLNTVLLGHLNTVGIDNARTESGTVYKTEKKSAPIKDMAAFWAYVVEHEDWDLVDKKANASAVEDFIAEHNSPPPGVNYNVMHVVGVRRS